MRCHRCQHENGRLAKFCEECGTRLASCVSANPQRSRVATHRLFCKRGSLILASIFVLIASLFLLSPMNRVSDSHYSMLLSESLVQHGSFVLDRYFVRPLDPASYPGYVEDRGLPTHIEVANGHLYYQFPVGSSVLSVPYVALMGFMGISPSQPSQGMYNAEGEVRIERGLAAMLMAIAACLFFLLACQFLPWRWGVALAIVGAVATPVWSTASRAMWNHTWSVLLLSIIALVLVRWEVGKKTNPYVLATLLSWAFFVRPSNIVVIVVVTAYVLICHHRSGLGYVLTGIAWAGVFAWYSWFHFGSLLPLYMRHHASNKLHFGRNIWEGLAGVLVSPSRGLVIFIPSVIFVCFLLVAFRKDLLRMRLVWVALTAIGGTVVMYGAYIEWWGGSSYGARYMTDLVPWIVLLATLALASMLRWQAGQPRRSLRLYLAFGIAVTTLGVVTNAPGALSASASRWNAEGGDVDDYPERLWDWYRPQFLAYLLSVPPRASATPEVVVPSSATPLWELDFRRPEATARLKGFWPVSDGAFRWSVGRRAEVMVDLSETSATVLRIKSAAFVLAGVLPRQRVKISLNGQPLSALEFRGIRVKSYSVLVPANRWTGTSQLSFDIEDAESPWQLGIGADRRLLGVGIQSLAVYASPPAGPS